MSELEDIKAVLDETANAIVRLEKNPALWLTSLIYLLKQLELKATGANPAYQMAYREMISSLGDTIRNRLNTGGW